MRRRAMQFIIASFLLAVICIGGGVYYFKHFLQTPITRASAQEILIPKGMGGAQIAEMLAKEGVISNALLFKIAIKTSRPPVLLIAGEYLIPSSVTPTDIITLLASGKVIHRSVTIPEGITVAEALAIIAKAPYLSGDAGDSKSIPEGSLFPETYLYQRNDTRASIILRMQKSLQEQLTKAWTSRDPTIPLKSPEEMLTLASIVEKETGLADERPHIASVFINRLRLGMKLQSDPTTIYGIYAETGIKKPTLSKNDLQRLDAYNTYTIPALPPTPIAIVGKAALEAIAHPENSQDIYFVATGNGGHFFASTLEEHNRNVMMYRKTQQEK